MITDEGQALAGGDIPASVRGWTVGGAGNSPRTWTALVQRC